MNSFFIIQITVLHILFLGSFCVEAYSDDWLCTETASIKSGNTLRTCGIGTSDNEADARIAALREAKREFKEICSESSDCKNRKTIMRPMRNACNKLPIQFGSGDSEDAFP